MPTRDCRHRRRKERQGRPMGRTALLGCADPDHPVQPEDRQKRHGQDEMRPAGRAAANARDHQQLDGAGDRGKHRHQEGAERSPSPAARAPEGIAAPPVTAGRRPARSWSGRWETPPAWHEPDARARAILDPLRLSERRSSTGVDEGDLVLGVVVGHGWSPSVGGSPDQARWCGDSSPCRSRGCGGDVSALNPWAPVANDIAWLWWGPCRRVGGC